MNTIAFSCARCGAALKVLKTFAGKTILCPRCAKKTPVPTETEPAGRMSGEAPAPSAPVKSFPADAAMTEQPSKSAAAPLSPSPETKEPAPAPPPVSALSSSSVSGEDRVWKERLDRKEAEIRLLSERIKELETLLETSRLRLERAERELASVQTRHAEDMERQRLEWTAQSRAELEAARAVITRLEQELRERASAPAGENVSAAAIERDLLKRGGEIDWESEAARADVAMSDLRKVSFARFLRAAVAIHLVVLGLTSLGYLYRRIRPKEPEPEVPTAAVATGGSVTQAPPGSAGAETGTVTAPIPATPATSPPPSPVAPSSTQEWETLPVPGETPRPTDIELKL